MNHSDAESRAARRVLLVARILTVLFAAFLSIFSLDAYDNKASFMVNFLAFFKHLMPVWMILFTLLISLRYEWIGGLLFALLGGLYIFLAWGRFPLSVYFVISGPAFLLSFLFFYGWYLKRQLSTSEK